MTASLHDDDLARLSDFVAERMGLHFPSERWPELRYGLDAARCEFGFDDAGDCVRWIMSAALSPEQIDVLASNLTIGETYFFRQKDLFERLETTILPTLIAARGGKEPRLRIWSAACCTGEEAFSIAILLKRLIPDLSHWNVTIRASDINSRFLKKAQAGEYREWSFRNAPDWLKEGYFLITSPGHYAVLPEIRNMVTFFPLNLVDDSYPSLLNDTNAMDLILCRNVLMYFAQDQAERVVRKLALALADGGWLGVSPCETYCVTAPDLIPVGYSGGTLFRKSHADPPKRESSLPISSSEYTTPPVPETGERGGGHPSGIQENEYEWMAMKLANQGDLEEALAWCDQALAASPLNPVCHYLRASILSERGDMSEAVRSLHRSLAIAPDFVLANFAMGNAGRQQHNRQNAHRHYVNALTLLEHFGPDDPVPYSEGLTAGRLKAMIKTLLEMESLS
ncbi:MAG: CheR family methyltransferase [bacterium]